jgi:hypothetical protein
LCIALVERSQKTVKRSSVHVKRSSSALRSCVEVECVGHNANLLHLMLFHSWCYLCMNSHHVALLHRPDCIFAHPAGRVAAAAGSTSTADKVSQSLSHHNSVVIDIV